MKGTEVRNEIVYDFYIRDLPDASHSMTLEPLAILRVDNRRNAIFVVREPISPKYEKRAAKGVWPDNFVQCAAVCCHLDQWRVWKCGP